jgi:hypothetical protein
MPKDDSNYISLPHSTVRRENFRYILFWNFTAEEQAVRPGPRPAASVHPPAGGDVRGRGGPGLGGGGAGRSRPPPPRVPPAGQDGAGRLGGAGRRSSALVLYSGEHFFSKRKKKFFLTKKI